METPRLKTEKNVVLHLCALKKLALADRKFLTSEKNYLKKLADFYCKILPLECSPEELLAKINLSDEEFEAGLLDIQKSPKHAKLLIKDLVSIALVDNNYCEEERKMVQEIGVKIKMAPETVREIELATMILHKAMFELESLIR